MGRELLKCTTRWLGGTDAGSDLAREFATSDECRRLAGQILATVGGSELVIWLAGTSEARTLARKLSHTREGRDLARDLLEYHPSTNDQIAGLPLGLGAVVIQAEASCNTADDLASLCAEFLDD